MLNVNKIWIALVAVLLMAVGSAPAHAIWSFQVDKDPVSGSEIYSRAIESVVTPQGRIFHLLLACEQQVAMYLIIPSDLSAQDQVKVHYRVDRNAAHDATWHPHLHGASKSQSVRVAAADADAIEAEAKSPTSRLTLHIDAPGMPPTSVDFQMSGFAEVSRQVIRDCAARGIKPGRPPAATQAKTTAGEMPASK